MILTMNLQSLQKKKKLYVIHDQNGTYYGEGNEVKFETRTIKSSLCDYSDA